MRREGLRISDCELRIEIMTPDELKLRTKQWSLRVTRLVASLPKSALSDVISRQLLRSALSVGANYRAACRARSRADFVSKIGIVEEEADESQYWLEIAIDANLLPAARVKDLLRETKELIAIFTSSGRTAKWNPAQRVPSTTIRNSKFAIRNETL